MEMVGHQYNQSNLPVEYTAQTQRIETLQFLYKEMA